MAIQMRQGNEVDFDAEKMLPGEWAVSTDAKIVRICFAPGIVARMATYEAFEADMVAIEAILKNVQDIQTAVKLVQAQINGKSELVAENASLAEEYMFKAKEYAEQAGAFTGMQIAKRDLLGVVKGGDMAVEDDGALRNFKRGSGNTFAVSDTVEAPLSAYKLYGKSVQDGVPTPDNPQPIVNVGEKLVDGVVTDVGIGNDICGKNLVKNFSAVNNSTAFVNVLYVDVDFKPNTTYTLSLNGTSGNKTYLNENLVTYADNLNIGDGRGTITFTTQNEEVIKAAYRENLGGYCILKNQSSNTVVPDFTDVQIEEGTEATEYSPYTGRSHTLNRTLRAIPVTDPALANYTDESGQMWCADTIEEVDGKMCLVERVGVTDLTNATWIKNSDGKYWANVDTGIYLGDSLGLCTHMVSAMSGENCIHVNWNKSIRLNVVLDDYSVENVQSVMNGALYYGILATTIITELTAEEVSVIESLHSYDGVTTVMSDAWAEVECATSNVAALAMYIKRDYVPKAKYDALESRISALEQQIVNA